MSVYVGLDCGGSSSRVLAVDDEGTILFQGQSGAANLVSTPEGRLRRNLENATKGCPPADYVCGCFAGLINETARERGIDILRDTFGPRAQFRAEPDYTAALYAATEADICVISGTGSLVCSRPGGKIVKSGGRGYILGDEGSGYQFGRDALLQFLHSPQDCSDYLLKAIDDIFGSREESVIVTGVYKAPTPATILGRLAKSLGHDAAAGEPYALASVKQGMDSLSDVVVKHTSQHHPGVSQLCVTLSGGVWKSSAVFKDTFFEYLQSKQPTITWSVNKLSRPPLHGAVEIAREMSIGN